MKLDNFKVIFFTLNYLITLYLKKIIGGSEDISKAFPNLLQLQGLLSGIQRNSARKSDTERSPAKPRNETGQGKLSHYRANSVIVSIFLRFWDLHA